MVGKSFDGKQVLGERPQLTQVGRVRQIQIEPEDSGKHPANIAIENGNALAKTER